MSAKFMVVSYLKGPYGGGYYADKWYFRTMAEARRKLSDLLVTLPDRYEAEIIKDE